MRYLLYILVIMVALSAMEVVGQEHVHEHHLEEAGPVSTGVGLDSAAAVVDSAAGGVGARRIAGYRVTGSVGDAYMADMDTAMFNYGNYTLVEGRGVAVGYLTNLGSPAQSKIFAERKEARDFIFADAYDYYITRAEDALFYDTKVPYTHVAYSQKGASISREDQLNGVMTWNFGSRLNIGAEMDYIYSRGQYWANGNKLLSYRVFASYRAERYELNASLSNYNFVNYENGGLANDRYLTHPDEFTIGRQAIPRREYPVRFYDTWNRLRGSLYYLTHRYSLGFERETGALDEDGEAASVFVPVSSLIHTFEYEDNSRRFISDMDPDSIDARYLAPKGVTGGYDADMRRLNYVYGLDESLNDMASSWSVKNTVALSMREGFKDWAKFGLTAFARFEKRRFKLPAKVPGLSYDMVDGSGPDPSPDNLSYPRDEVHDEFTMYLGGEISKRKGAILTYNARGEMGMLGDDLGEFRVTGDLMTTFPLFGKEASIKADGYIRNVRPAFFQRYHHSRYFWWDPETARLDNTQHMYAGGEVALKSTGTTVRLGVENIRNHVYFGAKGMPVQHPGMLQVVTLRVREDFHHRAFGWETEAVWQLSGDEDILPLPRLSAYTNIYVHFKPVKALTVQMGADVHYHTLYYAPYYEPATQQFRNQGEVKTGNYPLINAYLNFHLKQARFFVMYYNVGSSFMDPQYFSLTHYPLDPMTLKLGVAVMFNN
ncbi:MAG: putative porin [Tannerellaceae bacterium]|nr:putative porin [Tannerellaceae bacterium]